MKKEIMSMFSVKGGNRKMRINDVFLLETSVIDKYGMNIAISHLPATDYVVKLHMKPLNGKEYHALSNTIRAREYQNIVAEIKEAMKCMMTLVSCKMINDFENGYIY